MLGGGKRSFRTKSGASVRHSRWCRKLGICIVGGSKEDNYREVAGVGDRDENWALEEAGPLGKKNVRGGGHCRQSVRKRYSRMDGADDADRVDRDWRAHSLTRSTARNHIQQLAEEERRLPANGEQERVGTRVERLRPVQISLVCKERGILDNMWR